MTEQEAIEKIHSVYPTGTKNGLENMRSLMEKLGNPQERLTMVHGRGHERQGFLLRDDRARPSCGGLPYRTVYIAVYRGLQ